MSAIQNALRPLLSLTPTISLSTHLSHLSNLAQILGNDSEYPNHSIVDPFGNPHSEYILTFLYTFLILYRPIPTSAPPHSHANLRTRVEETGVNAMSEMDGMDKMDEVDKKAFGAMIAARYTPGILIIIANGHHHILRSIFLSLLYLHIG